MTAFDPLTALVGGALIGLAAALLMLSIGRIAGISGIFAGCIAFVGGDRGWRAAFVAGLVAAPLLSMLAGYRIAMPEMPASWAVIVIAGLLVGVGTRIGGGCTSGHGVCGLARLSARSVAATVIFMVTAAIVVAVTRHVIGA
jgi:uncharacterized membrane protein YedE/YeeE